MALSARAEEISRPVLLKGGPHHNRVSHVTRNTASITIVDVNGWHIYHKNWFGEFLYIQTAKDLE